MKTQEQTKSHQRDFKSRMFAMIFSDKKELLKLYNAVANKKLFKETFHITPAMLRKRTN